MRISDWSSDVCSSDLTLILAPEVKMNRNLYDRLLGEAIHLIVIPGVFSDLEVTPIRLARILTRRSRSDLANLTHGFKTQASLASHPYSPGHPRLSRECPGRLPSDDGRICSERTRQDCF